MKASFADWVNYSKAASTAHLVTKFQCWKPLINLSKHMEGLKPLIEWVSEYTVVLFFRKMAKSKILIFSCLARSKLRKLKKYTLSSKTNI